MAGGHCDSIYRLHDFGWMSFLDVLTLSRLRVASTDFRQQVHASLVRALAQVILEAEEEEAFPEVEAIARLAPFGDRTVIRALAARLAGSSPRMQRAALTALRRLASRGDPCSVAAVRAHLESPRSSDRHIALVALGQLALPGDGEVLAAVAACLEDCSLDVRMASTDALPRLLRKGDHASLLQVTARLAHDSEEARTAAAIALRRIAGRGDQRIVASLVALLADTQGYPQQCELIRGLQDLAQAADPVALEALTACLSSSHAPVRAVALEALATLAAQSEERIAMAVSSGLKDRAPAVRHAAVRCLERLLRCGSRGAGAEQLVPLLEDPDTGVRVMVLIALGRLMGEDHDTTLALEVAMRFDDDSEMVRFAATEAMGQLVRTGNRAGIAQALCCLREGSQEARLALERLPCHLSWLLEWRFRQQSKILLAKPRRGRLSCGQPRPDERKVFA